MRVLIITPVCPYGHIGGHASRVRALYEELCLEHEVWLLYAPFRAGLPTDKDREIIGDRLLSYGGWRHFLRKCWSQFARVLRTHRRRKVSSKQIHPDKLCPGFLESLAAKEVNRLGIQAVVVEYVFLTKALCRIPDGVRRVVDTHDLFQDRAARVPEDVYLPWPWCVANTSQQRELEALRRADSVLAIQGEEGDLLRKGKLSNVEVVPHLMPDKSGIGNGTAVITKEPLIVHFGSDWAPNVHGIDWFIEKVLPRIRREIPATKLRLLGTVAKAARDGEGVEKVGFVDDIETEVGKCRIAVMPVFLGTGLNIKVMEALCWGIPMVATKRAFRGLEMGHDPGLPITEDAETFATEVIRLLVDDDYALQVSRAVSALSVGFNRDARNGLNRALHGAAPKVVAGKQSHSN